MSSLLSIAQFEQLTQGDLFLERAIRRSLAGNYDEFRQCLEIDLTKVIELLEANPQAHYEDSEDQTTQKIVDILAGMGYSAHHNAQAGGNVDITIEMSRRGFRWIAEAKIFGSVTHMREGYLQLATRYTPALTADGVAHGGLIGYLKRPNAAGCMSDWRTHLPTLEVAPDVKTYDCRSRGPLGFTSEHVHERFGVPLRVWHVCISQFFRPLDKSGRTAAKYADASNMD